MLGRGFFGSRFLFRTPRLIVQKFGSGHNVWNQGSIAWYSDKSSKEEAEQALKLLNESLKQMQNNMNVLNDSIQNSSESSNRKLTQQEIYEENMKSRPINMQTQPKDFDTFVKEKFPEVQQLEAQLEEVQKTPSAAIAEEKANILKEVRNDLRSPGAFVLLLAFGLASMIISLRSKRIIFEEALAAKQVRDAAHQQKIQELETQLEHLKNQIHS